MQAAIVRNGLDASPPHNVWQAAQQPKLPLAQRCILEFCGQDFGGEAIDLTLLFELEEAALQKIGRADDLAGTRQQQTVRTL